MPLYEYSCSDCGSFEVRRDHRQSGQKALCPGCGVQARRVYFAPAVSDRTGARGEITRRMESGSQPRIGRRSSPGEPAPKPRKGGGRPWQIGH